MAKRAKVAKTKAGDLSLGGFCKESVHVPYGRMPGACKRKASESDAEENPGEGDGDSGESGEDDQGAQQQAKLLKQLKFPEVEQGSCLAELCPKASKVLQKRVTNLQAAKDNFDGLQKRSSIQEQNPGLWIARSIDVRF